jgi:hypothetical protein
MEKLERRVKEAEKALETLREIQREPYSLIVRDATIQRFEYVEEVAESIYEKIRDYNELMDTVFNHIRKKLEEVPEI